MSVLLENLISAETGFAEIQVKIRKTGFQSQKRNMEAMKYFSSEIKFSWNAVYVADTFIKKYLISAQGAISAVIPTRLD